MDSMVVPYNESANVIDSAAPSVQQPEKVSCQEWFKAQAMSGTCQAQWIAL